MRLGFIGTGIVGGATLKLAKKQGHKDIKIYDPGIKSFDSMEGCDAIFISVPVPTKPNGDQDLSILEESLARCPANSVAIIRSSVLPGTANTQAEYFKDIEIYSCPEFLTERTADEDTNKLPLICSAEAWPTLAEIFPNKEIITLNGETECEMVKYTHNAFCAVKVGFFNMIHQVCTDSNIEYGPIVGAAAITGFIEKTHTKVPGPDGKMGFGGKCLPKDLLAFSQWIETKFSRTTFLRGVLNENFYNRFGSLF